MGLLKLKIFCVVVILLGLAMSGKCTPGVITGPMRIMIVGDSITQGKEGDWTWRYRLWEWFYAQGVNVQFVGPYVGTLPPDPYVLPKPPPIQGEPEETPDNSPRTSGGYAKGVDSNFTSNHFGAWGRSLAQGKELIYEAVRAHDPDYLLVLLGFNDVGWLVSDAKGTIASMVGFISQAREAKSDIKFALGNIPQRRSMGGREDLPINTDLYNSMLATAIPLWSTVTSPINLVRMRENYGCDLDNCPAAYDGLHPNALGEYQIARAFSQTLVNSYSIGNLPLVVPDKIPPRPIAVPRNFTAVSSPMGITITWDFFYGALGYDLRSRPKGINDWGISSLGSTRSDTTWTFDGQVWEYQVRMNNGDGSKSDWTPMVSAVAHPETPPPVTGIVTEATAAGANISWDGMEDIVQYVAITLDLDIPGAFIGGVGLKTTGSSGHVDSLVPGHRYNVGIQGWNKNGGGLPAMGRSVRIGAGKPPPPTDLQITSIDKTTIKLQWCGSSEAAGYRSWMRHIEDSNDILEPRDDISETKQVIGGLFLGVWNYEVCVSAFNGKLESDRSTCLVCPQPGKTIGGPGKGFDCYVQDAADLGSGSSTESELEIESAGEIQGGGEVVFLSSLGLSGQQVLDANGHFPQPFIHRIFLPQKSSYDLSHQMPFQHRLATSLLKLQSPGQQYAPGLDLDVD